MSFSWCPGAGNGLGGTGLFSAGGHWVEEREVLKCPHMGALRSIHTGAHPGTNIQAFTHSSTGWSHVCTHSHSSVCMGAKGLRASLALAVP